MRKKKRNKTKTRVVSGYDKAKYYRYLKSPQWKEKRRFALEFYGNQCGLCGSRYDLEIHHRSYKNIFRELMEDLMVLCETCHRTHHKEITLRKWKGHEPVTYYPNRRRN